MSVVRCKLLPSPFLNGVLHMIQTTLDYFWPKNRSYQHSAASPPYTHFVQIGDPVLRACAQPVPIKDVRSPEIERIIKCMVKVLRRYDCVGVAAPQIGIPLRIIVMEFRPEKQNLYPSEIYAAREMSPLPLTVFINPKMQITTEKKCTHPEGCMSVKGYEAEVERFQSIKIYGVNSLGTLSATTLTGWNARIAQHEMDHLDGTIYVDRMDVSTFKCRNWENINDQGGNVSISFDK